MATWHIRQGRWWMVQWCLDGWLSMGVHVDTRKRINSRLNITYGPYIDLHIGCCILSVGHRPYYSSGRAADAIGRGGERAE